MSQTIRLHKGGGPEVPQIDELAPAAPKAGEVRIAVALGPPHFPELDAAYMDRSRSLPERRQLVPGHDPSAEGPDGPAQHDDRVGVTDTLLGEVYVPGMLKITVGDIEVEGQDYSDKDGVIKSMVINGGRCNRSSRSSSFPRSWHPGAETRGGLT